MRLFIALVLVASVGLFLTNPGLADFLEFVESESAEVFQNEIGGSTLGGVLAEFGGGLTRTLAGNMTERNSYGVCSVYRINLGDAPEDGWRFLGIAGQFIELQRPESIAFESTSSNSSSGRRK